MLFFSFFWRQIFLWFAYCLRVSLRHFKSNSDISGFSAASAAATTSDEIHVYYRWLSFWRRLVKYLTKLHHFLYYVRSGFAEAQLFAISANGGGALGRELGVVPGGWKALMCRGARGGAGRQHVEDDCRQDFYGASVWAHCEPSWHKSIKLRQSGRGARRASGLQGVNLKILLSKRLSTWVRGNFRGESVGQSCERVKSILRLSCAPGRAAGDLFSFLRRVSCFVWKHQLSEISVEKGENRPGNKKMVLCSGCLVEQ